MAKDEAKHIHPDGDVFARMYPYAGKVVNPKRILIDVESPINEFAFIAVENIDKCHLDGFIVGVDTVVYIYEKHSVLIYPFCRCHFMDDSTSVYIDCPSEEDRIRIEFKTMLAPEYRFSIKEKGYTFTAHNRKQRQYFLYRDG